ncbi:MAG: type II secretion system protein GspN [Thermodesulfovibrionales bacterium]
MGLCVMGNGLRPLLLYFTFSCFIFIILLFGLWHIVIPDDLIKKRIEDSFASEGIKLKTEGLRKGLFYSLTIDRIVLNSIQDTPHSFNISNIKAGLDFLSLLKLRPLIIITASIAGGRLSGDFSILNSLFNLTIEKAELENMGFLNDNGIAGRGLISGTALFYLKESKGNMRFRILDADLKDITGRIYLPLSLFKTVRGFIEFSRGVIIIHSLSLEGNGIYGKIQSRHGGTRFRTQDMIFLDGSVEVMVNSDFSMPQLVDLGLLRYRKSPGYYIIPLDNYRL